MGGVADAKLIVHNCRTYFGQSNDHTTKAEEMEAAFYLCTVFFMPSFIVFLFL
jgi:hypothetical protein